MGTAIEIRDLVCRFGKNTAVDRLAMSVPEGCVYGFLGRNGAGKTTTIKMLLGIQAPTSGSSSVLGLDSQRKSAEIKARVGYVPESHHIYRWMRVSEVLWFCKPFYPTWNDEECARLVKRFELDPKMKVKALSKGALAKLALTIALAHDPEILVLDEPTGGLDVIVRKEFLESIVDLIERHGKTVFISSHLLDDVERVAERIAILDKGQLRIEGEIDEIKQRVAKVTLVFESDPPPGLELHESLGVPAADVLQCDKSGREWRLILDHVTEDLLGKARQKLPACHVTSHRPTLEEIFIAFVGGNTHPEE